MRLEGLRDPAGVLFAGRPLGRGGEGAVFEIVGRPQLAMKLYFNPDQEREAKISAMVHGRLASTCPSAAVPQAIVRNSAGAFVGFTMRRVDGARPLHDLYGSSSRRTHFPGADWRMIVRTAVNVARAVSEVHAAGLVIGDINHSSLLVSPRSLVTLIDTDSWQTGADHLCRVGVPEYTPPELQGRPLSGLLRTEDHDAFGLAVLLVQLLFLGRHPFAGVPTGQPLALAEAIARHQFAYTLVRKVRLRPPSGTLLLSDLPPALRVGFERAFGHMIGPRYTAAKWAAVLADFERDLVDCQQDKRHSLPSDASSCPWCRVEQVTGQSAFGGRPVVFGRPFGPQSDPQLDRLSRSLDKIDTVKLNRIEPPSSRPTPRHSAAAAAFALKDGGAAHAELLRSVAKLNGGVPSDPFTRRHTGADLALVQVLAEWRRRIGVERVLLDMVAIRRTIDREARLAGESQRLRPCSSTREAIDIALRSARIAEAVIPGLTAGRRQLLTAAGMLSAADVDPRRLLLIVGLGDQSVASLLVWRDEIAASVISVDAPERARAAHQRSLAASEAARKVSRRSLLDAHRNLQAALATVMYTAAQMDSVVERSRAKVLIAAADMCFLNLPLPGQALARLQPQQLPRAGPGRHLAKSSRKGRRSVSGKSGAKSKLCPKCAASMVRRWGKAGAQRVFLGCTAYPICDGRRTVGGRSL